MGEGVAFSLYKIGCIDSEGNFEPEEAFEGYSVDFEDEDSALTLAIYIERDGIEPLMTAVTNSDSEVCFSNLEKGEYLVVGEDFTHGDTVYTPQPVIVSVGDYTGFEIEIVEKYTVYNISEEGGSESISVMKVWSGDKAGSVTAQLLRNGSVYDEVVLDDSNNWRYTWSGLDENSVWHVTEKEVPDGYKLRVDEDGSVFILVNTEGSDGPDEPGGGSATETTTETTTEAPPQSEETTEESGGGGGGSETTTEITTDSETEETTDSDTEETTDSDTEETTSKSPGGGGGGGSYYPETTTEAAPDDGGSSDDGPPPPDEDTEGTTGGGRSGGGRGEGGSDSSGDHASHDFSDSASSDSSADSSSDSAHISDDSSAEAAPPGEQSEGEAKLPQTGQLWYPVPILLWLGIIFLALGIRRKSVSL